MRALRDQSAVLLSANESGCRSHGCASVERRAASPEGDLIGSIGNLVEWYDFYAYTAFALYFANSFFPGNDAVLQQLNAAVLFAIGFVMRPIGGWLFGHLADHHGRRKALMFSVLLMCFGSLVIAGDRSRAALCHHDVDIRRAGGVHRTVVQVDRARSMVLLLPHLRDRRLALCLRHHA